MLLVKVFLLIYLSVVVLVYIFQRKLIYFPWRVPLAESTKLAQEQGYQPWTNRAGEPIGWHKPAAQQPALGKMIVTHGNGGNALSVLPLLNEAQTSGSLDLYVLEYPGYGFRKGVPSEETLFASGRDGLESLSGTTPLFLTGISLGTGVACFLASEYPERVKGVLLYAPYDNLISVGKIRMPILPVSLMQKDRFTSDVYLQKYKGPVAMMFAGRDMIVPNRLGKRLYAGYNGPKKFWEFAESGHNDLLPQPIAWWVEVLKFWRDDWRVTDVKSK